MEDVKTKKAFNTKVGKRIRKLRKINRYTIEEFAKKIDISWKFLNNVENGKQGCSAQMLSIIADALNVKCDYLVKGDTRCLENNELLEVLDLFEESQIPALAKLLQCVYEIQVK